MFYEYALEPAAISSKERARYFLDALGPWKGRFVARLPRHWRGMVRDGLNCPDIERQWIVERLSELDRRIFSPRANATFDETKSWLENALTEHARLPFHAIISNTRAMNNGVVLDAAEIDDRYELWRVESGQFVTRNADALIKAIELLLSASKRIVLIDQYFRADQEDKRRPLIAICQYVEGRASVEVHFSDKTVTCDFSMSQAERALPRALPAGMAVTLHCWKEHEDIHNRYIITEVGGVKFGNSIELGDGVDHLSILDETSRLRLWDEFLGTQPAYERVGEPREFVGRAQPQRRDRR